MQYTLRGKNENLEKFLSKIPSNLTENWGLQCVEVLNVKTYNYYCLRESETPFCVQITYQESYKRYDIIVSPMDSAKIASYDKEDFCISLLEKFTTDFESWALECDIKIEEVSC